MNIDELKREADEKMDYEEKIRTMQSATIKRFEDFFEIMDKSYSIWNAKMKDAVDIFVSDFKEYFKKNGFDVKEQQPYGQGETVTEIAATYKSLIFRLSSINYDSENMYFQGPDDISEEIWIALPNSVPNYYFWKDNIVVGKIRLVDMDGPVKECYKQFVEKFGTEEELLKLVEKININIEHFKESIDVADTIDLCIHRLGKDETYKNFDEFIDKVDNK